MVIMAIALPRGVLAANGQDGKQSHLKVNVVPDDAAQAVGEREFEDTLIFENGKFSSEALKAHGFRSGTYEPDESAHGIGVKFKANAVSEKEGKTHWEADSPPANPSKGR